MIMATLGSCDLASSRYYMQQPHVRNAMNLGNRSMSDGLEIYKAMIEDTMQDVKKELAEALDNFKVFVVIPHEMFFRVQ